MSVAKKFLQSRSGATAIEYGLIGSLISIAIVSSAAVVGTDVAALWDDVRTQFVAAVGVEQTPPVEPTGGEPQ